MTYRARVPKSWKLERQALAQDESRRHRARARVRRRRLRAIGRAIKQALFVLFIIFVVIAALCGLTLGGSCPRRRL